MGIEMDEEVNVLRRRADEEQRELLRSHQTALANLDTRQTKLETALADWANYLIRAESEQKETQRQILTLIGEQSRTSQQVISHMEAEERMWNLFMATSGKLAEVEKTVSNVQGTTISQIDNLKIVIGAVVMLSLSFAGYVMTRLHNG